MKIAVASDHRGFEAKEQIKAILMEGGALTVQEIIERLGDNATSAMVRTNLDDSKGELFTQITEDGSREIRWAVLSREYRD